MSGDHPGPDFRSSATGSSPPRRIRPPRSPRPQQVHDRGPAQPDQFGPAPQAVPWRRGILRTAPWLAPILAVAVGILGVVVAVTVSNWVLVLLKPEPVVVDPPPPRKSVNPTPSPLSTGGPAVPHGNGGAFLSPAYAQGVREFEVGGEISAMVGTSKDSNVVAVTVDDELRGMDVASTEILWTYPSYGCSAGSWDGVALCIDSGNRSVAYSDEISDIVGVDLTSGEVRFEFTPVGVPGEMDFIGSDDAHAYFNLAIMNVPGHGFYGQQHVLALDADGGVAWTTALDTVGMIFKAALADENSLIIRIEKNIMVLDRDTGSITLDQPEDRREDYTLMDPLWDGWLASVPGDEEPYKVFDLSGAQVAEYAYVDEYVPSSRTVGSTVVPVYASEVLNRGGRSRYERWAVNPEGQRVVGDVGEGIVDLNGNHLADEGQLMGLSADGGVFLSDLNTRSIHDARTGKVIGGFASEDWMSTSSILDNIVSREVFSPRGTTVVLLLPGPG